MINNDMYKLGSEPSTIRELFGYGMSRKKEIGEDKVFDFSIGNPSVPAPQEVHDSLARLLEKAPAEIHGYTSSAGDMEVRGAIARSIYENFGVPARSSHIYLTAGAAAAISISLSAITNPGDEVIVPSPFFPEYRTWIQNAGCTIVEVPVDQKTFQLDTAAIEAAITPRTSAVIINSPNNPVGTVYTRENLEALAAVLTRKEEELDRPIYLIADEPYRLITYGAEVPYVPCIYSRTIVCYSYSKCLSLPGERIGYAYVSDLMPDADEVFTAFVGAGRAQGFVCASSIFQYMLKECVDLPSDVEAYRVNREILTRGLRELGYEFIEPEGAFYLWMKALEPDAKQFSERAKEFELLLVPSESFGVDGWVRVSYCIPRETIENSMPAFKALMESYKA